MLKQVRTTALALLFLVSFFNYMDRYMLAVLLPAIKADLQLSDTEIGFITGLAFTLFYATMGIPIARLADRYSRKNIIAIALTVWSAMTALCGLAQNFAQLAVARIMVGVGEAGASPPSHSLIADLFPVEKRARALSIYALGAPVGILVGFMLGGWITQLYGWRAALFTVGIPGILVALVVYRKLHEPERGAADGLAHRTEVQPFWFSLKTLMSSPTFRHLSVGTGLYTVVWLGVVQWLPSFFTRSFGLEIGEIGTWLAIILSVSQIIGMLLGGWLADRLGAADLRWYVWVPSLAILVSTPMFALTFLTQNPTIAFLSLFLPFMIGVMQGPPSFAVAQGLADIRMRAMAAALLLLITNLIGGGIGPQAVGIMSDYLAPRFNADSLRYSLLTVSIIFGLWSSLHYFLAGKTIRREFRSPGKV
ncbi:MAG: MFS transporter [Gammaproteobacteria bacterium]|nr:MFS transporter [Gammaproteobacteria bacterium]MDE0283199.1 MFS transporter [Gammaproteobacteria bacterium]